jgi:hypothetical protein
MNPHWLFLAIMAVSVSVDTAHAAALGDIHELLDMTIILGLAAAVVGAVLLATRRYWQGARRLI